MRCPSCCFRRRPSSRLRVNAPMDEHGDGVRFLSTLFPPRSFQGRARLATEPDECLPGTMDMQRCARGAPIPSSSTANAPFDAPLGTDASVPRDATGHAVQGHVSRMPEAEEGFVQPPHGLLQGGVLMCRYIVCTVFCASESYGTHACAVRWTHLRPDHCASFAWCVWCDCMGRWNYYQQREAPPYTVLTMLKSCGDHQGGHRMLPALIPQNYGCMAFIAASTGKPWGSQVSSSLRMP